MKKRSTLIKAQSARQRVPNEASVPVTDSQSREEMRAFLQQRVAAFARLVTIVFGMFFVWRIVTSLAEDDSPSRAYLPWQALTVVAFGGLWLLCRGRPRSYTFLRVSEAVGLTAAASCAIGMCFRVSYAARPDSLLLLCMSYTLIARAIIVPSTARRTLAYGLVFAVPFLISVFLLHRLQHNPAIYTDAADPRLRLSALTIATRWTIICGLWWTACLLICTATSKVIYGLRQEVRDARRLGQYTLTERLGQGGMGVVYRARHAMLRRPSAIKLLPPEKFGHEAVARFEREVQLTASLTHPNTIRIFDYGRTPDNLFYYVMEYLEGATLADVVGVGGPMPPGRVIYVLDQVAGALSEAHAIGLIHRDIKPANIFLTRQGGVPDVAKVLDFGLVKQIGQSEGEESTLQALTTDNSFTGTPQYMAPEAIAAPELIEARTDLYSLGAVGYFLLTGEHVFSGRNIVEICSHHLHSAPPPPSLRTSKLIPGDLEQLVLRCLEKVPEQRPASARALQSALRACRDARAWSEDEARAWFDAHADSLKARQAHVAISSPATVAVDLGLRMPEAAGLPQAGG